MQQTFIVFLTFLLFSSVTLQSTSAQRSSYEWIVRKGNRVLTFLGGITTLCTFAEYFGLCRKKGRGQPRWYVDNLLITPSRL